ncbi:MAG: amidohydrolase family protein [Oscillospiraceae bacterium]|nr:amidohydrolase family protein [Oscillospiraceae bacterium]
MAQHPYRIADAHAHIYPDKIARKAADSIGEFYGYPAQEEGTAARLLDSGRALGFEKYLVCSVAVAPNRVQTINDFILQSCREHPGEFLGFGTIHPAMTETEMLQEAHRIKEMDLAGIKLHPDIQQFCTDDPHMYPLYRCAEELGLRVLFHCGDDRFDYSGPLRTARVLEDFPSLTVLGGHLGGYQQWEDARRTLTQYPNFFVDTSSTLSFLEPAAAREILLSYDPSRVMFGTDFPLWHIPPQLDAFFALDLPLALLPDILYGNFARLFAHELETMDQARP